MAKKLKQRLRAVMLLMGLILSLSFLASCSKTELPQSNSNKSKLVQQVATPSYVNSTSPTNASTQTNPCGGYYSTLSGKWIMGLKGGGCGFSTVVVQCEHKWMYVARPLMFFQNSPGMLRCRICKKLTIPGSPDSYIGTIDENFDMYTMGSEGDHINQY